MDGIEIFNTIKNRSLPYFIFEIGGNFRNFGGAKTLIDLAKRCGADAVKLQHFSADTITSRKAIFEMENTGTISQHEHFKKYELDEAITRDIFDYAREIDLTIFSTPSHYSDIDLLEKFNNKIYKIGSDDATNLPFIEYAAKTQKPIIISTGMCTLTEVQRAADTVLETGNGQLVLLHCTTQYPTHLDQVNLYAMQTMMNFFERIPIGYSDHTIGTDACMAAAVMGARVLEFHFTNDKAAEGPDHLLSKDPVESERLVTYTRNLQVMLGDGVKRPMPGEQNTRKNNRKSIVLIGDIRQGEKISCHNIAIKRPGYGIPAEHFYTILGKTASRDLVSDEVLSWDDIC